MSLMHMWNSKGVLVGGRVWGLPAGKRPWQWMKDLRQGKGKVETGHGVNAGTMDAWRLLERRGPRKGQAGGENQGRAEEGPVPVGPGDQQGWTQDLQDCKSFLRGGCDLQGGDSLSPAVTTAPVTAATSLELAHRDADVPAPSEDYSMSSGHPPDGSDCPESGPSGSSDPSEHDALSTKCRQEAPLHKH